MDKKRMLMKRFNILAISTVMLVLGTNLAQAQTYQWPVVPHTVTRNYSYYDTTIGKYHTGMDLTSKNTAVYAVASGTVRRIDNRPDANNNHGMGNVVIIDHNNGEGPFTLYAHLAKINVADGQYVTKGTQIGVMGNTGTDKVHLHFEVKEW